MNIGSGSGTMSNNVQELDEYKRILLAFPHIAKIISLFWGEQELSWYFNNLFLDSRDGNRQGLPVEISKDINSLWKLHEDTYGW